MSEIPASAASAPMRFCYRHTDAVAVRGCDLCHKPICAGCVGYGPRLEGLCPACAAKDRRRGTLVAGLSLAGAAVFIGGVIAWLASMPAAISYGEHRFEIERASARVQNTPCDAQSALELTRLLNEERDFARTIATVERFDDACKPAPRLWWESYGARMEVQDFKGAIADADRLIADSPDDGDFWWWRGKARRQDGDLDGAAADFEKAIEVTGPKAYFSVIDLVDLREQQQRPCDAVAPLAMLVKNQKDDEKARPLRARLRRLIADGKCPDPLAAMPEKGSVAAVCASAPSALSFTEWQASPFHQSLRNTWVARTGPQARGAAVACSAEYEEVDTRELLGTSAMRSWSARLICEGRPSVTAQQLHAVPLKAQEELIKKLIDGALRTWCTGS
jgi:tetratricopeptide (TPR) repeat protein